MAAAVVSIALQTLRDLLLEEVRFLSGVGSEVRALETQLKEVKCLLQDADGRQNENKTVHNWIKEIRDLAHRAEDAIETYAFHVSSRRGRGLKQLLRRFSCMLNECLSIQQIGLEISEIKSELARVKKSMQEYGIKSIIQGESSTANTSDNQKWKRQTFPHEIDDCYVGKDEELERFVSLIVDDKEHRVISVWGMGGIGKTTIARKIYNHIEAKRCFRSFAWVCITQQCQIRSVLEDVLKQLNAQMRDISSLSDGQLVGQLCEIQQAKRCMVVLDDLWEIDHWDGLKHAFLVQGSKSKILVTTRKQKVADMAGLPLKLELLSEDDGLELLKKKAFPRSNIPEFAFEEKWLQKIGKEMVRRCGFLPLAISLIGGVLSKKKSMREWELVNDNMSAHLYKGKGDDIEKKRIDGVLSLSYEDLPYYLKSCFLYMGQFREDKILPARRLYRMFIAGGMIWNENLAKNETLMDSAEFYFNELDSRCLVQVELGDTIGGKRCRLFKLHDVVRELCLLKVKEEDFGLQILDYKGGKFSPLLHESLSDQRTRHLAIHFESEIESQHDKRATIIHEDTSTHIRSLQFLNHTNGKQIEFPSIDFQTFKLLRVLVFERFKFLRRKLPKGIGNLIHIRYLCIKECELDEVPSSISNLIYLCTLDLQDSLNVRVPNILKKMYRLKHLILPPCDKEKIGNYRLNLDEGLDELETLLDFDSLVHELKSIVRMKNLRLFSACVRDNESLSAIINAINTNWKNLQYCTITVERGCQFTSAEQELMNLKNVFTCPNLHELRIFVHIGKLLEECQHQIITSNLVRLSLSGCEIEDDPMAILEKLPLLEELYLLERSYLGEEMKCRALGFHCLKTLLIRNLPNLSEWRVEQGAMRNISKIYIGRCPLLKMIPDGLRFTVTLRTLMIEGMPELGKRVSDEKGEDFHEVQHVPSIIIS